MSSSLPQAPQHHLSQCTLGTTVSQASCSQWHSQDEGITHPREDSCWGLSQCYMSPGYTSCNHVNYPTLAEGRGRKRPSNQESHHLWNPEGPDVSSALGPSGAVQSQTHKFSGCLAFWPRPGAPSEGHLYDAPVLETQGHLRHQGEASCARGRFWIAASTMPCTPPCPSGHIARCSRYSSSVSPTKDSSSNFQNLALQTILCEDRQICLLEDDLMVCFGNYCHSLPVWH